MPDIAITYIARGAHGLSTVERFLDAYRRHPAGVPHDLVLLVKGWASQERGQVIRIAESCGATILDVADTGYDWGAYFRAARTLRHEHLCLLNSYARPQVDGWLKFLADALMQPGVVMAGASGSCETPRYNPIAPKRLTGRIRYAVSRFRIRHFLRQFSNFPNPHLRSNAVLIGRSLFVRFADLNGEPKSKLDALVLESGTRGLSRFAAATGQIVIAGADGTLYHPALFHESRTFRSGRQDNLLVADNRSDQFENESDRTMLHSLAWGSTHSKVVQGSSTMINVTSVVANQVACHRCGTPSPLSMRSTDSNRHLSKQTFSYFECPACGLVFLDPVPHDIARFYAGGYQKIPATLEELREIARREKYRLDALKAIRASGSILEVGPWIGIFSINAKDAGYTVDTIEMDPDAADFLSSIVGVGVINSNDAGSAIASIANTYDFIVFWHSLEHLPKPWNVIKAAASRLKPSGRILIAIPNIAGSQARRYGQKWYHLDAPRHLYFWSPASLVAMCKDLGLELSSMTTNDRLSRELSRSADNLWVSQKIRLRYVRGAVALAFSSALNVARWFSRDTLHGAGITALFHRADVVGIATEPLPPRPAT